MNLTVTKKLLETLNIESDTALSGAEAIEKMAHNEYGLVLMDHIMPDMDGAETTKILRKKGYTPEKLPVILFTANAIEEIRKTASEAQFNDYLPKPISKASLVEILKKWLPEQSELTDNTESHREAYSEQIAKIAGEIKEIDIESALKRVDYKNSILESSIRIMTRSLPEVVEKIDTYLYCNDIQNFTIEVHGAKGSLLNIGANGIAKLAEELEMRSKAGDIDFCVQNLPELNTQLLTLYEKLSKIIEEQDKNSPPKKKGDAGTLKKQIKEVKKHIENFKSDEAVHLIKKLTEHTYGESTDLFLQKLSRLMEEFQYDQAIELITQEKI